MPIVTYVVGNHSATDLMSGQALPWFVPLALCNFEEPQLSSSDAEQSYRS
jgi:hypothetical protein